MKNKCIILLSSLILSVGCVDQASKDQARNTLAFEVQQVNKSMIGSHIDAYTVLNSCIFDGKNLIYSYEVNEDEYTITDIEKYRRSSLESMAKATWATNPQVAETKRNLKILGGSVIYNYVGANTKKSFTIKIKP